MDPRTSVARNYYYKRESRLGYWLVQKRLKHVGYYPDVNKTDGSTVRALWAMNDLVAQTLRLQRGQKVLDAGCGYGLVSTYLAEKYGVGVEGITVVEYELHYGKSLVEKKGLQDSVRLSLQDYTQTSFADDSFDAIFTLETLSHAYDVDAVLAEFYRILKPGGSIALFEYSIADDAELSRSAANTIELLTKKVMAGLQQFRFNHFLAKLERVGFTETRERDITAHVGPYWYKRLYRLGWLPYQIVKLLGMRARFINITASVEGYRLAKEGFLKYSIFTAKK